MYNSIYTFPYQQMVDFFYKRTKRHINLVQKYIDKIIKSDLYNNFDLNKLLILGKNHDLSKYKDPEFKPYIYITWSYKLKSDGKECNIPISIQNKMNQASNHHVKNNFHHPEYWLSNKNKLNVINRDNRDKPLNNILDISNMPQLYILEMCADWMGMSEELGNSPIEWANNNVNVRWKFNNKQTKLIYHVLNNIWK